MVMVMLMEYLPTSSCSLHVRSSVELPADNFFFFSSSSPSVKSTLEPPPGLALMTNRGGSTALTEFFGRNRNGSVKSLLLPDLLGTVISHILIEVPQMDEKNPKDNKTKMPTSVHLLPVLLPLPPVPRHPIPTTW